MSKTITTQAGDNLQRIAEQHGFKTMRPLIDANEDLADQVIRNKGVLPTGLTLNIPDINTREENVISGQSHRFQLQPEYMQLKVRPEFTNGQYFTNWKAEFNINYENKWQGYQSCGEIQEDGIFKMNSIRSDGIWDAKLKLTKNGNIQGEKIELEFIMKIYPPYFVLNTSRPVNMERDQPLNVGRVVSPSSSENIFSGNSTYADPMEGLSSDRKTLGNIRLPSKKLNVFLQEQDNKQFYGRNVMKADHLRFIFLDTGRWLKDGCDFGFVWGRHVYLASYTGQVAMSSVPAMRPGMDADFITAFGKEISIHQRATASWADEEDFDWDTVYIIIPDMHIMTVPTSLIWKDTYYDEGVFIDSINEEKRNELKTMYSEQKLSLFVDRLLSIPSMKGKIKLIQVGDLYDLWVGYGQEDRDKLAEYGLYDYAIKERNETFLFPLFRDTFPKMEIRLNRPESDIPKIVEWIGEITGSGESENPAIKAFKRADRELGNSMLYIYGNHDSYLRVNEVCRQANIPLRTYLLNNFKSIMIEHGQRMEVFFRGFIYHAGSAAFSFGNRFPGNTDGDSSGFIVTNIVYLAKKNHGGIKGSALLSALKLDLGCSLTAFLSEGSSIDGQTKEAQSQYIDEYATIWLHRNTVQDETRSVNCPHVFIIGHTHMPALVLRDVNIE